MYVNAGSSQKDLNLHGLYFLRYLEYLSLDDFIKDTYGNLRKTSLATGYEILVYLVRLV